MTCPGWAFQDTLRSRCPVVDVCLCRNHRILDLRAFRGLVERGLIPPEEFVTIGTQKQQAVTTRFKHSADVKKFYEGKMGYKVSVFGLQGVCVFSWFFVFADEFVAQFWCGLLLMFLSRARWDTCGVADLDCFRRSGGIRGCSRAVTLSSRCFCRIGGRLVLFAQCRIIVHSSPPVRSPIRLS